MTKEFWILGVVAGEDKDEVVLLESEHVLEKGQKLIIIGMTPRKEFLEILRSELGDKELIRRARM